MPDKAKLANIHIAKKDLAITEDAYRDILRMHFQATSSRDLNDRQATALLNLFKVKGWVPKQTTAKPGTAKRDGRFIEIAPGPAAKQQKKVLAMWNELDYGMDKLHARVKKQFGIDRFEWLVDHDDLHILITDLAQRVATAKRGA